ncbi:MAG: glycosyltransferase [Candidatus Babeliales bacterium]
MVVSYFPKLSETFILNQVIDLLELGHDVRIYAVKKEDDLVHDAFVDFKLAERVIYHDDSKSKKQDFFSKYSFDIILCHFGHRGYLGYELKQKYAINAPLFTIFHGVDMSCNLDNDIHLYDNLFNYLDLALPICNHWREKLVGLGYDAHQIRVHYLGVDCQAFDFKERHYKEGETIQFLTCARFIEKKGIEYAIKAFASIAQKYTNIEYNIIGDGPLMALMKELILKLEVSDKIHLLGSKTQAEVRELMQSSHILLAPSVTSSDGDKEGIPVSMMEAMAVGMPIISTYHSGIPELVQDGITGLLVEEKNVIALAEKIKYLILHPELWPKMGKAGRKQIVENFNSKKQAKNLVKIFYEFLNK